MGVDGGGRGEKGGGRKKCHTKTNETGRGLIGVFSESIIVEFIKSDIINITLVSWIGLLSAFTKF